ncbi:MAG TPA: hypothetical protein PK007_04025, partial [Candidatus Kapabacteria bacterium]|nr:hypothetical protein [Candidatus Kapabacteria bacterium]
EQKSLQLRSMKQKIRQVETYSCVNLRVSGNAKPKQGTMKPELKRIRKVEYDIDPNRYELRSGSETNAPLCPYGNIYKWVVFDLKANEYVRFAKSVFKLLINKNGK